MMIDKNKSEGNGIEENDELNPSTTKEEETSLPESEDISPEEKIKELEDQLLRSMAEMDNIRKRSDKERAEAYKIGASLFIRDMLPIIDNLQRALVSFSEEDNSNPEAFKEGISAITREFSSLLEKNNVETINPVGEKFDPNVHEAVFEAPSDTAKPGTIIEVIETGYIMEKRLLRPAKVGVSAKKETK